MTKSVQIDSVTLTGMSTKNEEHIITSSNAGRRKLSFQGWEKCLEAFSQGRGVLSHHCSRLISQQNETGHDEEAISWSSSDSEFEEHTQLSRQRPNRTLSSFINFDDCVSERKGRRRQTHARFSRSIEKRLGADSSVLNYSSQTDSHCKLQDCIEINELQESSHNDTSFAEGSFEHSLSVCQGVSVLNQKIYLFSESEPSQNVYSHDSAVASIPDQRLNKRLAPHNISESPGKVTDCDRLIIDSPQKSTWSASEACSPVLETRKVVRSIHKAHTKSPIIKTTRKKCGTKKEQSNKSQEFPFEIPVSPPLKLQSQVKKNKSLKLRSISSSMTNEENKSNSCSESNTQSDLDICIQGSLSQGPVVNQSHKLDGKEDRVFKSPVKNTPDSLSQNAYLGNEITSPIIGKKLGKVRRKQVQRVRSHIPRSPVLGSLRTPVTVKRRRKSENAEHITEIQVVEPTDDNNEKDDMDLGESSPSLLLLPRWELQVFRKEPVEKAEGNPVEMNCKSLVKRSLDFSIKRDVNECVKNIDSKEKTEDDISSGMNVKLKQADINIASSPSPGSRKIQKNSSNHENCNDILNESELIEDINTEQLNFENVSLKSHSSINQRKKRRKTLSLGKKAASEIVYINNTSNQTCMIECESQTQHISGYNPLKDLENRLALQQNDLKEVPSGIEGGDSGCVSPAAHANFTHYIEEVNTEPPSSQSMRKVGLMAEIEHKPKSIFENKDKEKKWKCSKQPGTEIFISQSSSNFNKEQDVESSATSNEGDADARHTDIESIDSGSPEKTLLDPQIEVDRWTSSYTPSPVTISQSSSPAPAIDSITPLQDDFNAPPKKGRKKLKVGGLASRLQKLLNRHRSSVRVWQYKRSKVLSSGDNSNTGRQDTGTLLCVNCVWTEYSHVVLQCHPAQENSKVVTTQSGNALSGLLLVILDPYVVEKVGRIITAPMIRLFPPWQALKSKGVTVIISASFIELVSDLSSSAIKLCASPPKSEALQEILCSCFSGADQGLCSLHPDLRIDVTSGSGKCKLVNLLFPEENHDVACLLSCVNDGADSSEPKNLARKSMAVRDTVSELVTCYSSAQTVSGWLSITILRIFQYKLAPRKNKELELAKSSPTWSALGRDAASEFCEVVLGSSSSCCKSLLNALEMGDALGKIYRFSNLIPVQRINPFRTSGLWGVVSNTPSFDSCEQSVLYIFAPAHDRLQYSLIGVPSNLTRDLCQPKIISLRDILSEDNACLEPQRASTICRLLHASSDRIYATDTQLSPQIIVILLKSTVYVTPTVLRGPLVLLVDLEVSSGEIKADKYTRIMTMDSYYMMENHPFSEEQCRSLASVSPLLPVLKVTTAAHSLVMLTGTIVGVDEASAFMWPACSSCGNELLSVTDTQNESYHCENCNSYCEQLSFRMSLQVLVTCSNLPHKYKVRIQLLQESIEKLLPSAPSREGYEMDTVLGKKIGPLRCEVLSVDGGNFTLQELPLL